VHWSESGRKNPVTARSGLDETPTRPTTDRRETDDRALTIRAGASDSGDHTWSHVMAGEKRDKPRHKPRETNGA